MTTLKQQLQDSLDMQAAKTFDELQAVCSRIEARMEREGVTGIERTMYEGFKAEQARRVALGAVT